MFINGVDVSDNPRIMKLKLSDFILINPELRLRFVPIARTPCKFLDELWLRSCRRERTGD